jgi:hypothetical protein
MRNILTLLIISYCFTGFAQAQEVGLGYNYTASQLLADAMKIQTDGDSSKFSVEQEAEYQLKRKSPGRAFIYSLMLPGAGEIYMGYKNRAAVFLGIEALAWAGLIANDLYAQHLVDEYKTYAVQHAGVNRVSKDKQYWIDIGKFDNIYEFNDQRERDRFFDRIYEDEAFYYWQWDSRDNRFTYDAKRINSGEVANRDVFFIGALVLNRLVSAVHSLAMARKHNRQLKENMSWNLHFDSQKISSRDAYFKIQFSTRF